MYLLALFSITISVSVVVSLQSETSMRVLFIQQLYLISDFIYERVFRFLRYLL